MTSDTSHLQMPLGFFTADEMKDSLADLPRFKKHITHLELQQFAFTLRDFLIEHPDIDQLELIKNGSQYDEFFFGPEF